MTSSRKQRIVVSSIIVAVVIGLGLYTARTQPLLVKLATVERGTVEATVANTRAGTIKACHRAKITPAAAGQIARLLVKEGDKVAKDDLLLELWNDDLIAQVKLAESEAIAARQNAEQECVLAESSKREADRQLRMQKDKLVSDDSVDKTVSASKAKVVGCRAARTRASVADSRLAAARAALEKTQLRAPFNGQIAEVNGEVGEFVTPSPAGIITLPAIDIVDRDCLFVAAPIDEVDAPRIVEGMEARITLDAFPNTAFLAAVRRKAPYVLEVEKQARTVEIEAVFMDEKQYAKLLPGYSADLEIILDTQHDVIRVPTEAVLEDSRVLVYNPITKLLEERKIEKGIFNWKYTQVKDGLSPGERVVVSTDREGVIAGALAEPETTSESEK